MQDWTAGYVADIGYTYGYYPELNPLRLHWTLVSQGIEPPAGLLGAGSTGCELGFGQGVSINMHAAGSQTAWWGTDFNPAQTAFAKSLGGASQANIHLFDEAFADFCSRSDLPDFDFIGLHGIWTWVSDENRQLLVDFLRRKLKVGGVAYMSYNCQPGWSAAMPMRHLLTEHARVMGTQGQGILGRIEGSLGFAEQLFSVNPRWLQANPQLKDRLDQVKKLDKSYLAHEYFNRDWEPMHFSKVASWMSSAKLAYACSSHYLDHVDAINLTAEQKQLVMSIQDPVFRETVRDYCTNFQFRRDIWIKGPRRMSLLSQAEALRKQRVVLVQPRPLVMLKATGAVGECDLQEAAYGPVLDVLADHVPKSIGHIEQEVAASRISFGQLREVITILLGTGALYLAQDDKAAKAVKAQTDRLNNAVAVMAKGGTNMPYLASPLLAGGFPVPRFHQIFLLARGSGMKQPAEWANTVWQVLQASGQKIVKNGTLIESNEENLAELQQQAHGFADAQVPILKALGIIA